MAVDSWAGKERSHTVLLYSVIGDVDVDVESVKEKKRKPFVGFPKEILEKYKMSIENISEAEIKEVIDKFLNK